MLSDRLGKWVLGLPLSTRCKMVLFALLAYCNWEDRTCYPGMQQLAEDTGLSERSVRGSVNDLRKAGHVRLKRAGCRGDGKGRGRMANVYLILVPEQLVPVEYRTKRQALPERKSGPTGKSNGPIGKNRHDQPAPAAAQDSQEDIHQQDSAQRRANGSRKKRFQLPFDSTALVSVARSHGLSEPLIGESTEAYRARLQSELFGADTRS